MERVELLKAVAVAVSVSTAGPPRPPLLRRSRSLLRQDPQPHYLAAHAAEDLGKLQEALAGYQQCIDIPG